MNLFLSHINLMPFMYGFVLFLSAFLIINNIVKGRIFQAIGVSAILYVGFAMHGEQSETRMGVAIAALLLDLCWSKLFPSRKPYKPYKRSA